MVHQNTLCGTGGNSEAYVRHVEKHTHCCILSLWVYGLRKWQKRHTVCSIMVPMALTSYSAITVNNWAAIRKGDAEEDKKNSIHLSWGCRWRTCFVCFYSYISIYKFKGVFVVNVILFHYFSNVSRTMFCSEPLASNMLSLCLKCSFISTPL